MNTSEKPTDEEVEAARGTLIRLRDDCLGPEPFDAEGALALSHAVKWLHGHLHGGTGELAEARRTMARHLADPELRRGYVDNVAMFLHDNQTLDYTAKVVRDAAANRLLRTLFGEGKGQ